ncbi:hypothetical protein LR48_Vigan05g089400 [Vigna angularis]|uniref:Uncharacterized protein n=1 Tax=Phaseolus angularis TaxID=3914 RepID=A0A0L9UK62_PHAAN|nr:hypothetical protein LR48_Vigan05g089400 [Vigna angularis]
MASPSSSSRRKEKVARVKRNANPSGWISDPKIRGKFLFWRVIKSVLPHKTVKEWFFRDELTVGSTPTPAANHTAFIPQTDFEKYVIDQFRKKSERDERVKDTLFRWEKKGKKNAIGFETEDSDDESTDED